MEYPNNKIKILVVEDHHLVRQGIIAILKENLEIDIIGDVANGKEALSFLKSYKPDVVLMDVEMPIMNGKEALEHITKMYPQIKVIMLSMHKGYILEKEFMDLGAYSYLTKQTIGNELLAVIKSVSKGRYYYFTDKNNVHIGANCGKHLQLSLNEIEIEIVKLVCNDKNNIEISRALNISIHNIRYYRRTIYTKTRTSTIAGLVKYAIRNGIILLT